MSSPSLFCPVTCVLVIVACSFAACGLELVFNPSPLPVFVGWTVTLVLALVLVVVPALVVVVVLLQVQIHLVKKRLEPCDKRLREFNADSIFFSVDRSIWLVFTLDCSSLAS